MSAKMSAEMKYAVGLVMAGNTRAYAAMKAGVTPSGIWRHFNKFKKKQAVTKLVDKQKRK